jgi:prepilin-type N-terminal cleavage/methylation domain-containing protein
MRRSDAGFTLLEVMAAVAVVGIVFTVLARAENEGLLEEGVSKRRLEASLLADQVLSDFEEQIATGTAPEIGQTEFDEGNFHVLVDVTAFDLAGVIPAREETPAADTGSARETSPGAVPSVAASAVRAVDIAVSWREGANAEGGKEYRVTRNSFGLDLASIEEQLQASGVGLPSNPAAGDLPR